jgi:hypothetical protein
MGVKSFQGARKQQSTTLDKALKVKDYMSTYFLYKKREAIRLPFLFAI